MTIIALPINPAGRHIAPHFTRASLFLLFDEEGREIARLPSPLSSGECCGKHELLSLLKNNGVQHVVVRNIGTRMLEKLLDQTFTVLQTRQRTYHEATLKKILEMPLEPLLEPSQVHASPHHHQHQTCHSCHGH